VSTFTVRGVFIWMNQTSTDLEKSVWHQVEAGQPSHMVGRLGGVTSTDSAFSSSCKRVATKALVEPPQNLVGRPMGPLDLGSGPLGPHVQYTPVVMMILTFGQLYFVIP
jgi:hypothetical protein